MILFECKKCGEEFDKIHLYERHKNRIKDCVTGSKTNKKDKKKFHCGDCKKGFVRKDSLKRHYNVCKKKNIKKITTNKGENFVSADKQFKN